MKTDKQLELLIDPIINIYQNIELDLLTLIAKKFDLYESVGVSRSLKWYTDKLNELGGLNSEAINVISEYSDMTRKEIVSMLEQAGYSNFDYDSLSKAYKSNLFNINPNKIFESTVLSSMINNSYKELDKTFKLINTKAIESVKQSYMDILNQTFYEVSGGYYDYQTSIRRAIEKMLDNGIDGASYKRQDKIVKYSLESTVRRDIMTAVVQTANKGSEVIANELSAEYYEVSFHLGARTGDGIKPITDHGHWQGKVYKIDGIDNEYDNFYTQTGYGDILGLGGVNCRHRFWAFFPGVSKANPIQYSEEENSKVYELSKKQRQLECNIRNNKKKIHVAQETGDKDLESKARKSLNVNNRKIKEFCNENNLTRNYNREQVFYNKPAELYKIDDIDIPNFKKEHTKFIVNNAVSMLPDSIRQTCKDTSFKIQDEDYSMYKPSDDIIYIGKNANTYDVIHEIGHVIDNKMDLFNDKEFVNIISNKFGKYSIKDFELIKYPSGQELYQLKDSTGFLNKYQTSLYKKINDKKAFNLLGRVNCYNAKEYFSEGLMYYFKDPSLLRKKDEELFNYIFKVMGEKNE